MSHARRWKRVSRAKLRSTTRRGGSRTKPFLGCGELHQLKRDAVLRGDRCCHLACVALIDVRRFDRPIRERLQLANSGVKLTKLPARQAAYIGVNPDGPYKPDHYRY